VSEDAAEPTPDSPTVLRPGDVVRSDDGSWLGVVLAMVNSSCDDRPRWELHVDAAEFGIPQGIGVWAPSDAVVSNDPASTQEAKRLGLRWPTGHPLGDPE
jgi:hypothetical protein